MESAHPPPPPAAGEPDERALLGRARAGDTAAYRILVDRHRDRAYGLALRILRSPLDAEEVAQDGFVRAWLALPRFRGESSFGTWLHRIVARRAFDRAAVLKARRARERAEEEAGEIAAGTAAPGGQAALALRLERLMERLSERECAVVTLFYYEGLSVQQVAETLEMPPGTVKSLLSRARTALREGWLREERSTG
jgi:RNA polymerase sigma-70 factor (ECF subfamily)